MDRIAFLGCSRGLGQAVTEMWPTSASALLSSRKEQLLAELKNSNFLDTVCFVNDFSNKYNWLELTKKLEEFSPNRIFYFAGGGPHGEYAKKEWKDHDWAFHVNFLTPAHLIHWASKQEDLSQFIAVGSSVAENNIEPLSPSYGASKKALKGLLECIQEGSTKQDIRLFSPTYMATDMLPINAEPRKKSKDPKKVAQQFITWSNTKKAPWHLSLS